MIERLFVYGTLQPGFGNHRRIGRFVRASQAACVTEFELVDLGAYPAMVPGQGAVRGVLLDVEPAALEIADRIEGYAADRAVCLYLRQRVTVHLADGRSVEAWTYVFADPDRLARHPRLVVGEQDGRPLHAWPSVGR